MKKKFKHAKYTLGYETHSDPFKAIDAAFQYFGVDTFKDFVTDILLFSTQKEHYDKESIPNIFDLRDSVKDFILLSYHIYSRKFKQTSHRVTDRHYIAALCEQPTDNSYCWKGRTLLLDAAACQDPYAVFSSVFEKWLPEQLNEHFVTALYSATISYEKDEIFEFNFLDLYLTITALIEACYLIFSYELLPINNKTGLRPTS